MIVVGDGMEEGSERETRINKIDGMIARCQRSANSNSFSERAKWLKPESMFLSWERRITIIARWETKPGNVYSRIPRQLS